MRQTKAELEVSTLRKSGAYMLPAAYGLIEVSGPDAVRFLQSRTTACVDSLQSGSGHANTVLDRKAHVEGCFTLHRLGETFYLVAETGQIGDLAGHLERYLFNDKVDLSDRTESGCFLAIQGIASGELLALATGQEAPGAGAQFSIGQIEFYGHPALSINRSITGEEGFLIWLDRASARQLEARLREDAEVLHCVSLSDAALQIARVEAGLLQYGTDITAEYLLPETGLEETSVSYTKGCYLGQEVIARIKTFGAPRRGIVGLLLPAGEKHSFPLDAAISINGSEIGSIKSNVYSYLLGRTIAFAYLYKEYRRPGDTLQLQIGKDALSAEVCCLPFYTAASRQERAHAIYDQAMSEFASGDEIRAVAMLEQALRLDPLAQDCYETLGVMLSRHDRLDEAIVLMSKLVALEPNSVMAHANLSVFYMQKGDKEKAEEEKAIAMSIRMQQLAREVDLKKQEEEAQRQNREESLRRLDMFKQVLEIDSEDLLANYGLGSIHVELQEFAEAIPFLSKAIAVKPTHSVAYLALGKAYQGLNQLKQARKTYEDGIAIASKKGDMTPLKEIQGRLAMLESQNNSVN